jgi:hypothetical protein
VREEGSVKFFKVGGIERSARVKYKHVFGFFKSFNKEIKKHGKQDVARKNTVISNEFFFGVLWKCLDKSGMWPFRKPFRSQRHMSDSILYDELPDIIQFVSRFVLDLKVTKESDEESKKKQEVLIQ